MNVSNGAIARIGIGLLLAIFGGLLFILLLVLLYPGGVDGKDVVWSVLGFLATVEAVPIVMIASGLILILRVFRDFRYETS